METMNLSLVELESNLSYEIMKWAEKFDIPKKKQQVILQKAMNSVAKKVKLEAERSYSSFFPRSVRDWSAKKSISAKISFAGNEPRNLAESIKQRAFSGRRNKVGSVIYSRVHSPWNGVLYGMAQSKGFTHNVPHKDGSFTSVTVAPNPFLRDPTQRVLSDQSTYSEVDRILLSNFVKLMNNPNFEISED